MSVSYLFPDDTVLFGQNIPPEIDLLLQQAVKAYDNTEESEKLLWQAQALDPEQLEVYIALYKFYFYKYRLADAQRVAELSLEMCAKVGGFEADWTQLTINSADWSNPEGAERIYLYTLKALSFIRLRQLNLEGAEQVLTKLQELDPLDQVGSSVLRDVAASFTTTD
ncbi:hypothetical protein [Beggiatoa leptomitoformis]|uniref:Tetratricopeptide repeat protein n=1 Tax=Beggiatoa leptomitoformis TaxID=288004 RepID=A0A2N9YG84_9GAMM|nr:hypothetical protein [Beggiatoa leptomitoformis]ALG68290.1 hypothetical protein AL038_11935 [Beggiatoa leptomitoformis]AUI69399.1 hypothetical protein BLE401_12330 [Beggiatoa leptomitoformis]